MKNHNFLKMFGNHIPIMRYMISILYIFLCNDPLVKVESLSLDSNGYYDIVVAISEKTAQNANQNYTQNLMSGIQDLSDALFESTTKDFKRKFAIRSADIIVPNHWNVEADAFVTTQTYENADIRISHEFLVPQTINPVFCAYPGHYIELPYNFFDELDGPYGPTGKALLTLWARFRWGVHEEHGYPGDPEFPYFWKAIRLPNDPESEPENWRVTNCANTEVKGTFKNLEGEECGTDPEDKDQLYPPPSDCRFHPDIDNQTVTSSLMSFHFIKSLMYFCNEETHNKRTPTRQNHFCQFKSAWEVIQESQDWQQLDESKQVERSRIKFRILKKAPEKPILFILTDGVNKPSAEVITAVSHGLEEIFSENTTENWNVLASVGVFPGTDKKDSFDTLYPLNFPWFDHAQLISSFESSFETRTGFRNFGAAIQDIGNRVRDMKPENGAIILVIKYGSETDFMMRDYVQAYESETLGTLLEQNMKVFALEGNDDQGERLKNVAEFSGGMHFKIGDDPEEDRKNVEITIESIKTILRNGNIPSSRYRVAFKEARASEMFDNGIPHSIPIAYGNVKRLLFYFHEMVPYLMDSPAITKGPDSISSLPNFRQVQNWGKDDSNFKSYLAELNEPLTSASEWEYTFNCNDWNYCYSMLVVIAELDDTSNLPGKDISISVSTSVEYNDNVADLNVESTLSLKGSAFSIFAKLEKNGHPINNPELEVKAHVLMFREGFDLTTYGLIGKPIDLLDDGKGSPDMTANDGIFSGTYIPISWPNGDDGVYQIFVTATLKNTNTPKSPLPIDQVAIRCGSGYQGCWSETVHEPFFTYADLKRRVQFKGSLDYAYKTTAFRITDLKIYPLTTNRYELSFTEPIVETENGHWKAEAYEIYYTENFFNIFGNGEGLVPVFGIPQPVQAGRTMTHTLEYIEPGSKYFFVMRATGQPGTPTAIWSNVVFLHTANPYIDPTTTTSTTTTPKPTDTTTKLPTSASTPSTPPTRNSPTTTTTPTTSIPTRTTTRTTTTSTTTTTRTTAKYIEITTPSPKRWFKSTEAVVTFSVFGVASVGIIAGVLVFIRMANTG